MGCLPVLRAWDKAVSWEKKVRREDMWDVQEMGTGGEEGGAGLGCRVNK